MKKNILPICAMLMLITSGSFASDEELNDSISPTEECSLEECVQNLLDETQEKLAELAHHDPVVLNNFEELAFFLHQAYQIEKSLTIQDIEEICLGVKFAAEKHRFQTRKNPEKTPYICHPIGVANNLMGVGGVRKVSVIIGALLHDTVEDTQTTFEEIEDLFGKEVANLVREVTDNKSLAVETRKRLQVIRASHKSKDAAQIKLADKLYNLRDLLQAPPSDWTEMRIDHYYEWAHSVINRLPKSNDKLLSAVEDVIDAYWEKQ